jgi:tetratricopeptide (TPR) repeat protein
MPREITEYRVFIASPGGLQEERQRFRDALIEYNASDALPRGVVFTPVGWEDTLGGIGRPQSLINEELRECDFFVLVLWDRWGTPPGYAEGRYTSGTEEEFAIAHKALLDDGAPMQKIVAFFKAVDPKQLSDPGFQLSKVLEFRKQLEAGNTLLYQTFDSPDRFSAILRRHLGGWLLADGKSTGPVTALPPDLSPALDPVSRDPTLPGKTRSEELDDAWNLANDGRRTEAETVFSRAIVRANDSGAFIEFGRFLGRDGRIDQALVMFERAKELAQSSGHQSGIATALRAIGNVLVTRGEFFRAEEQYRIAFEIEEKLGCLEGLAKCYGNLGVVLLARKDLVGAEAMHRSSLEIEEKLGRLEGMAADYGNLGNVLHMRGDLPAAESMHRKALEIGHKLGRLEGMAVHYCNLGFVLSAQGDLDAAKAIFRKALEINNKLGQLDGTALSLWGLGEIALTQGDEDEARELYGKALAIYDQIRIPDRAAAVRERLAILQ